jgi:hypothetical protein
MPWSGPLKGHQGYGRLVLARHRCTTVATMSANEPITSRAYTQSGQDPRPEIQLLARTRAVRAAGTTTSQNGGRSCTSEDTALSLGCSGTSSGCGFMIVTLRGVTSVCNQGPPVVSHRPPSVPERPTMGDRDDATGPASRQRA